MKNETKAILASNGKLHLFTEERYEFMKATMVHGMKLDAWLKNYLSLDPYNKSLWIADHLTDAVEREILK